MKKILFALAMLIAISSFAQDSTKQKKPVAPDSTKQYAIILNENEITGLFQLMKAADEKPSIISQWLQLIASRARLLQPPAAEEKKKK